MEPGDMLQNHGGVWKGRLPEAEVVDAGPPYQVFASDVLLNVVDLNQDAAKAALPEGLDLGRRPTGLIGFYKGESGSGFAPYSGCFFAIKVEGYEAPGGSSVFMKVAGWYSGKAGGVMQSTYDDRLETGEVSHWHQHDVWGAQGGPVGRPLISVELRRAGEDAPLTSSTHYFVGASGNELTFYSISFAQKFIEAECLHLEVLPEAPPLLRQLEPKTSFCYYCPTAIYTFSRPQRLPAKSDVNVVDAARLLLLDVFLRLGRAAAILGQGGRILYVNQKAETLAGDGFVITGQHLRAVYPADQPALAAAIEGAFAGQKTIEPVPLRRRTSSAPLLVRAMPMDSATVGEKAILVLFTNPLDSGGANVVKMLRLLGLSPAEARIAVLVGTGLPPKEVALQLSVSDNTVRSQLKAIYDKLAINRQSELAQMVARLGAL